uniref:Uncharacterized protein n=1 Tax=Arundo donax TaxID=35708 RepID=A0A0A9CYS5_ARUDO
MLLGTGRQPADIYRFSTMLLLINSQSQVNYGHNLVTTRGMHKPGSMVSRNTGVCWYIGDGKKANLLSKHASTTFSSTIAKFCPMQVRGPCPNGMYICASLHAAATLLANRSGRNSPASGPQASLSRCSIDLTTWMIVPRTLRLHASSAMLDAKGAVSPGSPS